MPNKSPPPASQLSDHLGFWLRFVSNHVSTRFAALIAEEGVTVSEWVALRALYEGEAAPSRLAKTLGMTKGAITKLADRLIAKDLIRREAAPGDARAQRLSLTPRGATLTPRLAALADANDAAFFGHLSGREREALERTLRDIVKRRDLKTLPVS